MVFTITLFISPPYEADVVKKATNQTLETNADSASLRRHRSAFRWAGMTTMRHLTPLVLAALMMLCGCASRVPRFMEGTGDAGQFILRHAVARGGLPINTNNLPTISGSWRYSEDQYGVIVRLTRQDYDAIEAILRRAFGPPQFGPTVTTSGGRLGGYRLTPKGGAIQFGYDDNGTQVIVLRPLTGIEAADAVVRAAKVMDQGEAK